MNEIEPIDMSVYPNYVYGQIYAITNNITKLQYIGQSRSHYRNRNKWIKAGYLVRWHDHVKEAYAQPRKQSTALNNAIRKHDPKNFSVKIIFTCPPDEMDIWEELFISLYGTYHKGYNLTTGGKCYSPSTDMRDQISKTLVNKFDTDRLDVLKDKTINVVKITQKNLDGEDIIVLKFRTDKGDRHMNFGGIMRSIDESIARAIKFALSVTSEDKIIVQKRLQNMVNLPNARPDDILIQIGGQRKSIENHYEALKHLTITSICISPFIGEGVKALRLNIAYDKKRTTVTIIRKHQTFEQTLTEGTTLALQLTDKSKIKMRKGLTHELI